MRVWPVTSFLHLQLSVLAVLYRRPVPPLRLPSPFFLLGYLVTSFAPSSPQPLFSLCLPYLSLASVSAHLAGLIRSHRQGYHRYRSIIRYFLCAPAGIIASVVPLALALSLSASACGWCGKIRVYVGLTQTIHRFLSLGGVCSTCPIRLMSNALHQMSFYYLVVLSCR